MPSNKPGSRLIKAAGGVAWRPGPDGEPEILLVHRKKYDDWSLPKGKTEPGETLPVTAVREVLEEGGAQLALGRRLVSVRYSVGGRPKRVHYWAARVLSVDSRAVPNSEVDEVAWLPARRAVDKVSYAHDHGVLADFAARPAGTVPLILLRHAKALDKHGWKKADAGRPLADSGRADAKVLADVLACFAPRQLISSTAVRCTDTLRPLAKLVSVRLRVEPSLFIHNQSSGTEAADPVAIAALVREVIASGEPTVLCAHRENIPALREAALAALGGHPAARDAEAPAGLAELPRDWDEPLPTSGFWVLNIAPVEAGTPPETAETTQAPRPAEAPAVRPARRWWQRLRARGQAASPAPAGAPVTGTPAAEPGATVTGASVAESGADGPAAVDGPVGVLISADRYDLSES
jgi:8-oxo-dGTP diphosphatase